MTPNKYRCETCENLDCQRHGVHNFYPKECDLVTEAVGCSSHSGCVEDFVSLAGKMEGVTRKDEREKVLDEAIINIQKRIDGIFEVYRDEKNEKVTDFPYTMANGMGEAINLLKELRRDGGLRR